MSVATSRVNRPVQAEIPPLQNGDLLSREEFERRYEATPNLKKAELIEGIVYTMPPPVSDAYHSRPHFNLIGWMFNYCGATPGILGGDNGSIRLDLKNEPQPDGYLRIAPEFGGQAKLDEEGYVVGAPELVAEVAASSASYDLHVKLQCYLRHRVKEYIVWRVYDDAIDWFVLRQGKYEPMPCHENNFKSETFPGLWLNEAAMRQGDIPGIMRILQQGISTPEHKAFLARLQKPT